ncbi:glycosyltransferase [Micromonospora mirobrigensis]|uniref:Glycosyltransferase involved in cell wall bisynthesis n=1 Tax=Micromonospora mirobrigensis TaxID=262898 RepID=A0A1C4Z919_9ACTN|nr:glycosyltransferase [Micromonospora mirobrigensis]SCF29424.1 Glycosyltransferase involved in cell wall bisynthesis [Micromonospora mirobrigensis]
MDVTGRPGWVAIVGPFLFPWGQASSRRVYGIAGSLAAAGRHVVVASGEHGPALTPLTDVDGPGSVSYLGLGEIPPPGAAKVDKALRWWVTWGARTVRWLDAQPASPSHVVLYGGETPYAAHLRRWCRRNRVPLVVDVVEWYSPKQVPGGRLGPQYLSAQLALNYHYARCDGVIAISSYLGEHYRRHRRPVLRIPPTLDVRSLAVGEPGDDGRLRLAYAGDPGRKDLLATIVRAVERVDPTGRRIELRIIGPGPQQVAGMLGGGPLPPGVRVLGRLPQQEVPATLQAADFSVLVRPVERFTRAGFPTKFAESLANGTPVIANLTSDLGRYLTDGVEGLVCRDNSVQALGEALGRALRLGAAERGDMRAAARRQAIRSFDFRAYAEPLGTFLDAVGRP